MPEGGADGGERIETSTDERDSRLAAAEARVDELLRALAAQVEEQKAARARMEREKERVLDAERAKVAEALLDSIDELERAIAAGGAPEPGTPLAQVLEGVRLSLSALLKRVGETGAERLRLVGQPYDPRVAEAVDLVPVADAGQDQLVVDELRPGWKIGDRVLRPARVRVGRFAQA